MSSTITTLPMMAPALPEIVMGAGALLLVLLGAVSGEKSYGLVRGLTLLVLVVAGVLVV